VPEGRSRSDCSRAPWSPAVNPEREHEVEEQFERRDPHAHVRPRLLAHDRTAKPRRVGLGAVPFVTEVIAGHVGQAAVVVATWPSSVFPKPPPSWTKEVVGNQSETHSSTEAGPRRCSGRLLISSPIALVGRFGLDGGADWRVRELLGRSVRPSPCAK